MKRITKIKIRNINTGEEEVADLGSAAYVQIQNEAELPISPLESALYLIKDTGAIMAWDETDEKWVSYGVDEALEYIADSGENA